MLLRLKKTWLVISLLLIICLMATVPALAQSLTEIKTLNVQTVVKNVISFLLGAAGLVAVIFLIYGGFSYMSSGGEEKKAIKARGVLTAAIIGLVIVLLSWAVTSFVATRFLSTTGEVIQEEPFGETPPS